MFNILGFTDTTRFSVLAVKFCPSLIPGCFEGPIAGWTVFTLPSVEMTGGILREARVNMPDTERTHLVNHCGCGCRNR